MDEIYTEVITGKQFLESMTGQEVQGVPMTKQEDKAGQQMARHRVRVSFDFDVVCNNGAIINASDDTEAIEHDLALLKSFLVADKVKLLDMMVDCIGSELSYHPEAFMSIFLSQVDTNSRNIFKPAIEALDGDKGKYWREVRDEPNTIYGEYLSLCTEHFFKCFSAKFVSSSFELVDE